MDNSPAATQVKVTNRVSAATRFVLELDGKIMGYIKSVEGGGITADVISERIGPDYYPHKHLAGTIYEEVSVAVDLSLEAEFYACITNAWDGKTSRNDLVVYTLDGNSQIIRQDEYFNTVLTEVTLPGMDSKSKDLVSMAVKFAPEYTRFKKSSGKLNVPSGKSGPKKWLAANFRFDADGLPSQHVSNIDTFTVKQPIVRDTIGDQSDYRVEIGRIEYPNLAITMAESHAELWQAWFDDFVVKGNNGDSQEKTASLAFLSADLKAVLSQINFSHMGIFKLAAQKVETDSEEIRRLKAELYVERMQFVL